VRVLDAAAVSAWAAGCVHSLASLRPAIDEINVYPVADSDTGSNMLFTMTGAAAELAAATPEDAAGALKILARGAVAAAKGNSGVILSQVVRGLADRAEGEALPEPLVVNCTGLGTRALFGDESLVPVRGQLVVVEPQVLEDYMVVAPREGLYMLPRRDGIVLGGTHERGSWALAPSAEETTRLLAGHAALLGRG